MQCCPEALCGVPIDLELDGSRPLHCSCCGKSVRCVDLPQALKHSSQCTTCGKICKDRKDGLPSRYCSRCGEQRINDGDENEYPGNTSNSMPIHHELESEPHNAGANSRGADLAAPADTRVGEVITQGLSKLICFFNCKSVGTELKGLNISSGKKALKASVKLIGCSECNFDTSSLIQLLEHDNMYHEPHLAISDVHSVIPRSDTNPMQSKIPLSAEHSYSAATTALTTSDPFEDDSAQSDSSIHSPKSSSSSADHSQDPDTVLDAVDQRFPIASSIKSEISEGSSLLILNQAENDSYTCNIAVSTVAEKTLKLQHAELMFKCQTCMSSFITEMEYENHISSSGCFSHRGDSTYAIASASTNAKPVATKRSTFQCKQCDFIGRSLPDYIHHRKEHPNLFINKYSCPHCKESFTAQSYIKHIHCCPQNVSGDQNEGASSALQTSRKRPCCEKCKRRYSSVRSYQRHIAKGTCSKQEIVKCSQCDYFTDTIAYLKNHELTHKPKPISCDVCGKTFRRKVGLRDHMHIHTGEKIHECEKCNMKFGHASIYYKHIRNKCQKPVYEKQLCSECGTYVSHLSSHINVVHKKIKLFVCDICGGKFSSNEKLKQHTYVHTGEKPYKCDFCEFRCKQRGYVNIHMRKCKNREVQ